MIRTVFSIAIITSLMWVITSCRKDETLKDISATVTYDALYVVNGESNSISVINLATNIVEKTIDLGNLMEETEGGMITMNMENLWPHHIYLSPDKSKLAIAAPGMDFIDGHNMMEDTSSAGNSADEHSQHHNSGTPSTMLMQGKILILDALTGVLLKEILLPGMTHNAVFSPDGKELWAAIMMTGGEVKVFDANTYQLINTIPVGDMPAEVTFTNDGSKVFVANGMSNTVTVVDAATKQVLDSIQVGEGPVGAWPGMNGMMYVDNEVSQEIHIINSMNMMMMDTVNLGFKPGMVSHNNMIDEMWVSDPEGSKVHYWSVQDVGYVHGGAFAVGDGAHALAFTSDGATCYITNQSEGTVSVVDVNDHQEIIKITVGYKPNGMVIRYK